jgi:hypothetical protein
MSPCGGIVSQIWTWKPVPWRCLWLGAMTFTRQPVMRRVCVSSRSISPNIWERAASDDSEPSNVTCGAIFIKSFQAQRVDACTIYRAKPDRIESGRVRGTVPTRGTCDGCIERTRNICRTCCRCSQPTQQNAAGGIWIPFSRTRLVATRPPRRRARSDSWCRVRRSSAAPLPHRRRRARGRSRPARP